MNKLKVKFTQDIKCKDQTDRYTLIIENVTEDKNTTDNDYCFNTIELNRNSGLLKSTKMENTEGLIVIYTGNFNCELAKQKF